MAWTTPTSRSTGDLINETIWNGDVVDNLNYLKTKVDERGPIGQITMWPTNTAPTGWLLCYGQAISRSTYATLFALIGTTFGSGDGSTTFNLPDMRGRTPVGQDDMGGTSANRVTDAQADSIGGAGGAETHTLATSEMPAHTHKILRFTTGDSSANQGMDARTPNAVWSSDKVETVGGGGAHNNMPPWLALNFIIYAGV